MFRRRSLRDFGRRECKDSRDPYVHHCELVVNEWDGEATNRDSNLLSTGKGREEGERSYSQGGSLIIYLATLENHPLSPLRKLIKVWGKKSDAKRTTRGGRRGHTNHP